MFLLSVGVWGLLLFLVRENLFSFCQELELSESRSYRQTKDQYTVELFMVVDYAAYKWWYGLTAESTDRERNTLLAIKQYYSYIFNGIDLRFRSIDTQPFGIDMAFVGIYVAKSENESEWTSGSTVEDTNQVRGERLMVNSSEALEKFQIWIDETTELPTFDHAVLFTGTNLTYAGSPGNTGLAFASSMCRNISNSSIVEDSFDFRTITYATQQIARSLGASDDMDNNDCLEFFNYIMTPKLKLPNKSFPSNRWRFSTCSLAYFQDYLDRLNLENINCLLDTSVTETYPAEIDALIQELPGKIYSADQQCKHALSLDSYACRDVIKVDYSKVCYGLPCYSSRKQSCEFILPADGTPCGNKKYCLNGKCSNFEAADERLETCPFGNSPPSDCSNVTSFPRSCYEPSVLYDCCDSCLKVTRADKGCEFGDRISSCTLKDCLIRDEKYSTITCCLTCANSSVTYAPQDNIDVNTDLTSTQEMRTLKGDFGDITSNKKTNGLEGDLLLTTKEFVNVEGDITSINTYQIVTDSIPTFRFETQTSTPAFVDEDFSKNTDVLSSLMVSEPSETLHPGTKVKRSSPVLFTRSFLRTADPIKSPATVKPPRNGYQPNVGVGMTTREGIDITVKSLTEAAIPEMISPKSPYEIPSTKAVGKTEPATTEVTETFTGLTGIAVTSPATPVISSTLSSVMSIGSSVARTPCPTLPARFTALAWERNLSLINKKFFGKLAIAMKSKQRSILYGVHDLMQGMYRDMTAIIQERHRQGAEENVGISPGSPSFVESDLLQILRPIWRRELTDLLIQLNSKVKQLRYRVLALNRRYLTRKTKK